MRSFLSYFGVGGKSRVSLADPHALEEFLRTRASHVAQTALYGYLRTRAGTRFPELFSDETFVKSINIAKWHIWLACLSDLALYAGILIRRRTGAPPATVARLVRDIVDHVLHATGIPPDAGSGFGEHAERVRSRLALCDWNGLIDEDAAFTESPEALVKWAPVADELKQLDEEIVRNSVRFRWQEVRRELRNQLDTQALATALGSAAS